MVAQFMKDNLSAKKFLVLTPSSAAANYAQRVGFKSVGILSNSVRYNNEIADQYMMEMAV